VQVFDIEESSSEENCITFIDNAAMEMVKEFYLFEDLFKRQDGQSEGYLYFKQKRGAVPTKDLKNQLVKQCQKRGILINNDYSLALVTKKALVFKDNKTEDIATINSFDLVVDCSRNKDLIQELNKQNIILLNNFETELITINYLFKLKKSAATKPSIASGESTVEEETIFWERICKAPMIHTINGKKKIFAVACLRTKSQLEVKVTSANRKSIGELIDKNKHTELGMEIIKPIFGADIKLLENGASTKPILVTISSPGLEFSPSLGNWQKERSKSYWALLRSGKSIII